MQTISLHGKVSDDGILRLEVHDLPRGKEVEAVVVLQEQENGALDAQPLAWVDALYGSCANDPIERPDQGSWPEREEVQ